MSDHKVACVVSLVPVMNASLAAKIAVRLGGNLIPELRVMADDEAARENVFFDYRVERFIIWASLDPWTPRWSGELKTGKHRLKQVTVCGTHNSMVAQPNVHRLVCNRLGK